jgi:WD40 repeat protein/serine/threonine protein kinase
VTENARAVALDAPEFRIVLCNTTRNGVRPMSWREAEAARIFLEAVEHHERGQWDAFVREAAAGDPLVLQRVAALLKAHGEANLMLDGDPLVPTEGIPQPSERSGTVIGPYKLLEQIGEGGFGVVFLAEQTQPVRRKVALKILKPGLDTRQVVARFEAERQALAIMDHPNIAKVHDGGTTPAGRPYFIMELVKGVPITDFCDQNRLTPRQRLELFVDVCAAVQHAHQKGIIHRDLKPSNVLVSVHDTTPVVKVIDFGVAKALGQELTDKTLFTGFAQMIGTPLYMSPEQAGQSGLDVDTRSDIYSLGVLLYELLTGTTPFDKERFRLVGYDEMRRIIREEEPPRPSTRISTLGQAATAVSAQRQSDPSRLACCLRGELDWIVMKCLDKDRNRRYETANGLGRDIERYLHDEPVLACPPSAPYRLRKLLRRNKRAALAVSLIVLALVCGIVGTTLALLRAQAERDDKEKARQAEAGQRAEAEASLYRSLVSESRALLLSGRAGWRAQALDNLRRAATLDTPERDLVALRTEAVAVLAGFDVKKVATEPAFGDAWSLAFSPDSSRLAVAGSARVALWDLRQGGLSREREIPLHGSSLEGLYSPRAPLPSVRFHPDGRQIAFNTWDRAVDFHALQKGGAALPRITGQGQPRGVTFDRQGKVFAVSWIDGQVGIYDAATGKRSRSLPAAGANQWFQWMPVALSPDGQFLATEGAGHGIELHDLRTGRPPLVLGRHREGVRGLCFSGDGRLLASGSADRTVKIWDVRGGEPVTLLGHVARVNGVALSPDGELAASGGDDLTIRLWDTRTGQGLLTLQTPVHVLSLGLSPDGAHLAVAGGGQVSLFRLEGRRARRQWLDFNFFVNGLDFHPRQDLLAVGCKDQTLTVRELGSGRVVRSLRANNGKAVEHVAFSPDGALVTAGYESFYNSRSDDHDVRVWDAMTGQVHRLLRGLRGDALSVGFDPSGKRLVASGSDGAVCIWDLQSAQLLTRWTGDKATVRFLGGDHVIVWYRSGTVELRDATGGRVVRQAGGLEGRQELGYRSPAFAVAPDGRRLALPCRDGAVRILGLPDLELVQTLAGAHRGAALHAAFSPDGRWFASAGADRTVVLRDARTFRKLLAFPPHHSEVWSLAFDRHSVWLAASGGEQQVTLWDLKRVERELASVGLAW